jgi:xylulose-5-phosphate/fructose-6-phosphate phosphoketolase
VPGQNFIYTHLDRVIKRPRPGHDLSLRPRPRRQRHGRQDWLDGSYTEIYPNITRDEDGMQKLFKQFSFPGGIPSHCGAGDPGLHHEGGELGYSLAHALGAVL